MDFDFIISA